MSIIRTAILGYGRSGSTLHADPLQRECERFKVQAVCDISPEARAAGAARFACAGYDDYLEMLRREPLDLVVIVTRSDQHAEMACACLQAGLAVLVTKPWAVNAEEAERMMAAARAGGGPLLPWLPARWGCDLRFLQKHVAEGTIGKVFMIRRSEYSFARRCDWQTCRRHGGGYLLNWGPHIIDQALQLAAEPASTVYGQMRQIINPGDVEDDFHATLVTASGLVLNGEFSIAARGLPNWVVQGDRGTIFIHAGNAEIHQARFADSATAANYGTPATMEITRCNLEEAGSPFGTNRFGDAFEIYPAIARALNGEEPYPATPESALQLTRTLDAVRLSAAENRVVSLD